jgi:hypothetical protein
VKRFRQGEHHDVEAKLRRYRPQPRPAFLAAVSENLHEQVGRPRIVRRAAVVTALTAGMLTMFAIFGGIGYASSAAHSGFHVWKLKQLIGISHHSHSAKISGHSKISGNSQSSGAHSSAAQSSPTQSSPADDEYRPGKGCGDKNHIHLRENECKKPPK